MIRMTSPLGRWLGTICVTATSLPIGVGTTVARVQAGRWDTIALAWLGARRLRR